MDAFLTVDEGNKTASGDVSCSAGNESPAALASADTQSASVVIERSAEVTASTVDKNSYGHRAGFDAFMTGCIFAWSAAAYRQSPAVDDASTTSPTCDVTNTEFVNRVYLGGKDFPLQVTHSSFAKPSKHHLEKWRQINSAASS